MDAVVSFLSMGGYWAYVWPAFGIAAVVMVTLVVFSLRTVRARQAELDALESRPRSAPAPSTGRPGGPEN